MIRKFYSPGEFAGATAENVTIVDSSAPQPEPVAETVTPEPSEATIVDIPVEAAPPAEVAPVVTQVEQPTQTAPPPAVPQEVTPQVVQKTLKDLLQDEGYDEKVPGMLAYYKQHGNLKPYLEAISVDFKSMSPEEIMRRDIREQYPDVDTETQDLIYQEEVTKKYNLDPDLSPSEQLTRIGQVKLKNDAEKLRQKFIEKQSQFLIPEKDFTAEQQRVQEEHQRQALEQQEQFKNSILNSPIAQSLNATKALSIDLGDGSKFNYAVEPAEVMDLLLSPEKFQAATTKKDASGNIVPDMEALVEVAAFLKDRKAYNRSLITHGKSLGKKESFDSLENVERVSSVTPVTGEESLADAFLNRGVASWRR